ncbi:hypothetical protein [Thiomicrospira sp. WB1]|uniref:hypothetical protein n=1 Tax=Thiomicrospira sp. WB1 TaxID=1685380 RepID=UPI00074875D1|nr:hypothetical protein [Thiomicrospira sp. WB1]KUJ72495.1 hypothetical protein AVO41_01400 [Thiomicrospira sp. WB1]
MSALTMQPLPKFTMWHLKDPEVEAVMAKALPDSLALFTYQILADESLVARLGRDEFLAWGPQAEPLISNDSIRAFQRGDAVFELSGDWRALLAEICIHDFRQTRPGDFLMTTAAGVNVWLLIPDAQAPLWLGCDPTYEVYLHSVLERHTRSLTSKQGV